MGQPEEKKDVAISGQQPGELIRLAIDRGADLDKLEKVLALQERFEANEAKKAYNQAMAMFKANAPNIGKDKRVSFGTTKYNHASLFNVTDKINAELSKWGLSSGWFPKQNGQISVTCRITHKQGHFEEVTLNAPADNSGSKNAIQQIGSTITYLQRYTLLSITGLATQDQDDDGRATSTEYITEKQHNTLVDLIAEKEINLPKFLEYMKLDSLETMPKSAYNNALKAIDLKKVK